MPACLTWMDDHYEVIVDGTFIDFGQFLHLTDRLLKHKHLPEHVETRRPGRPPLTVSVDSVLRIAHRLIGRDPSRAIFTPQCVGWRRSFDRLPEVVATFDHRRARS